MCGEATRHAHSGARQPLHLECSECNVVSAITSAPEMIDVR
jgi:hypothetical protein